MSMRCDSHVHIVGPPERYRQIVTRTYRAGPAPIDVLQRLGASRGVSRFVIVQPSFYGTDNTLLLESLDALGGNGRGVAVVDPATATPETLAVLARRGVTGLRLNLYSTIAAGEATGLDRRFAALAEVARPLRWHIEVIAAHGVLAESAEAIAGAGVPVVIDHYGLYDSATPQSPEGRRLLNLLACPNVWMKLSAPYRVSNDPLATRPDTSWLAAILAVAPDRCVWGSDWPHTPPHAQQIDGATALAYRPLSYERLVDDFVAAVGSQALAERIMRDNPARLYGF
jgi:predicted TIM-barrel fold metal-dependent hydrolase